MGRNIASGPHVGRWVAEKINGSFCADHATAIGLEKDGEVVAGVIYENWNGKTLTAHMAVSGVLTASFIAAIFDYAFQVCNAAKVILPVASANVKSNRFVRHLGFSEEARIKDGCHEGDVILYTLAKKDCRFLGERFHGKIRSRAPAGA